MLIYDQFLKERFGQAIPRNAQAVNKALRNTVDGDIGQVLTVQDLYAYIPKRFEKVGMVTLEDTFKTVSYMSLVANGSHSILRVPTFLSLTPTSIKTVTIGEDDYFELYFEPNSLFIESTLCYKKSAIAYMLYNEILAKPNMCVFFNYDDALLSLSELGPIAGLSLSKTNVPTEIVISTTTRNDKDFNQLYRHALNEDPKSEPAYIGLRNVQYGVTNLPTAVMGSYSDIGIDTLLTTPVKKLEKYEQLLRS